MLNHHFWSSSDTANLMQESSQGQAYHRVRPPCPAFHDTFNSPLNKNYSIIQIGGRLQTNRTRHQIKQEVYICVLYKLHAGLIFQSISRVQSQSVSIQKSTHVMHFIIMKQAWAPLFHPPKTLFPGQVWNETMHLVMDSIFTDMIPRTLRFI